MAARPMRRRIRGVTKPVARAAPPPRPVAVRITASEHEDFYKVWPEAFDAVCKRFNAAWKSSGHWNDNQGVRHEIITDREHFIVAYAAIPRGGLDYENGHYTISAKVWHTIDPNTL